MNLMSVSQIRNVCKDEGGRPAIVQEPSEDGGWCEKVVDIRTIEEGDEVKEIIVDEELDQKIRKSLRFYRYSLLYIAVMLTIVSTIFIFERI